MAFESTNIKKGHKRKGGSKKVSAQKTLTGGASWGGMKSLNIGVQGPQQKIIRDEVGAETHIYHGTET